MTDLSHPAMAGTGPLVATLWRIWRKVLVPLAAACGVGVVILLTLWLGHGVPGLAPLLALLAAVVAGARLQRCWPRPRVVVDWRQRDGREGRGGPVVLPSDTGRDAGPTDFASWTAMLVGVAGLLVNTALLAFGAPGLPFDHGGSSLTAFFALLCAGLYWRP